MFTIAGIIDAEVIKNKLITQTQIPFLGLFLAHLQNGLIAPCQDHCH